MRARFVERVPDYSDFSIVLDDNGLSWNRYGFFTDIVVPGLLNPQGEIEDPISLFPKAGGNGSVPPSFVYSVNASGL